MSSPASRTTALLLAATALAPLAHASAATCPSSGGGALTVGTVADVAPGAARSFSLNLGANEGVIVDLSSLKPPAPATTSHEDGEGDGHGHTPAPAPHTLKLCDTGGKLLAPQPGEVFEKGGSVSATSDGERLRFVAPRAGQYVVSAAASDEPREILVRRRSVGASPPPVVSASSRAARWRARRPTFCSDSAR